MLRQLAPRTLSRRLLIVMSGAVCVMFILIALLASFTIKKALLARFDLHSKTVAQFIQSTLYERRSLLDNGVDLIVDSSDFRNVALISSLTSNSKRLRSYLDDAINKLGIDSIELMDAHGRSLSRSGSIYSENMGENELELAAWAMRGKPLLARFVRRNGKVLILSSRPIWFSGSTAHDSAPDGVLNSWVNLDQSWALSLASQTRLVMGVTTNGRLQTSSIARLIGHVLDDESLDAGIRVVSHDGAFYRFFMVPLVNSDGRAVAGLLSGQNLEQVRAAISEPTKVLLGGALAVTAAMLTIMLVLLSGMTRSLRRLVTAARAITVSGPESFTGIETRQGDPREVTELSESLDIMVMTLRERLEILTETRQDLVEANTTLEQRIQQKTEALETSMRSRLQSEKLVAVGQLAAGVAHEINNPLGVILGFTQSLLRQGRGDKDTTFALSSIEREGKRCKELVQSLLTFSRQKQESTPTDVLLSETIYAARMLIENYAKFKNIKITIEASGAPLLVQGYSTQLQQVLINLCTNAVDAMESGGMLTIRAGSVENNRHRAFIEVADTGAGIPADIQARIFDPFFTTKEPGKGTGLGLSLVFEIVKTHSGQLTFKSAPGQGTTFRIELPVLGQTAAKESK